MARDLGVNRIPVTGERNGADFEDALACYQVKCRKAIPGWLWDWLSKIIGTAWPKGKAGVLVLKQPRMRDTKAIVVLSWQDWVALHGDVRRDAGGGGVGDVCDVREGVLHDAPAADVPRVSRTRPSLGDF